MMEALKGESGSVEVSWQEVNRPIRTRAGSALKPNVRLLVARRLGDQLCLFGLRAAILEHLWFSDNVTMYYCSEVVVMLEV